MMQDAKQNHSVPSHTQDNLQVRTEEVSVTISAWMDGDAQAAMPDVLHTLHGKETWQLYHLIGDALRTPELARPVATDFSIRVSQAIADEPTILAPRAQTAVKQSIWMRRYGWPSLAMAAAVASVVWVARPFLLPEVISPAGQVAFSTPAGSEVKPIDPSLVAPYVSAHRQVSGPSSVRQVSFGAAR